MRIVKFAAGMAVGYVLGSRAGRDRYDQIVEATRKAQSHPAVTQVQQKAKALLGAATESATPDHDQSSAPTSATAAGTPGNPSPSPGRSARRRTAGQPTTQITTSETLS